MAQNSTERRAKNRTEQNGSNRARRVSSISISRSISPASSSSSKRLVFCARRVSVSRPGGACRTGTRNSGPRQTTGGTAQIRDGHHESMIVRTYLSRPRHDWQPGPCADPEHEDEGRERYLVVVVVFPWAAAMAAVTSWRSDERTGRCTYAPLRLDEDEFEEYVYMGRSKRYWQDSNHTASVKCSSGRSTRYRIYRPP